ncbi:thrombospondin type 1 domain-containing protein, putative [Eimeria praecox]|uniref:Thrombospondin type 1 domain-containing protein, putative n=1 Tax=Eimeria praecox TaxID=51316 RepID=U6G445_9EIME|nr:thrombospondin type 1 domain-containing protein, putative [Eimeria praecox]
MPSESMPISCNLYQTPESGTGSLSLTADLGSVCGDTATSYVLCEDIPEDRQSDSLPVRRPVCERAFSTVEGATEEDDAECRAACEEKTDGECAPIRNVWLCVASSIQGTDADLISKRGSLAPNCSTAESVDSTKASTSYCKYICGNIEWRCRFIMTDNPTLYKDLMQCFDKLKVGTILEFCQVKTTPQTPTAGAANMAASWLLASGTETTVRFAQPIYPTPVVFIGSPSAIAGLPKLAISHVTSDSFRVQTFGVVCGVRPTAASSDIKLVASYLAIPPGQYITKHAPMRLVVGSVDITAAGEFLLRIPFTMDDPSKAVVLLEPQSAVGKSPQAIAASSVFRITESSNDGFRIHFSCVETFSSVTVGYLVAYASGESSSTSPLAASLGGRSLAIFDSRDVDMDDIHFPANLPAFFQPHFFPQLSGEGPDGDEIFSVQWQHKEDGGGWIPAVWASSCSLTEDVLYKVNNTSIRFTGLYISAVSSGICNIKAIPGGSLTDEECTEVCSGIYLLYCSASSHPLFCLEWRMPTNFANDCNSPTEKHPSKDSTGEADVGEGKQPPHPPCSWLSNTEDVVPLVKCRVFDMRAHPSNLAWDSASFTCGCPGLAVPCTEEDATQDLTWLEEMHAEGGLCESAKEPVQPVTKMFLQLDDDACSDNMLHAPSLSFSQRAYPSYPDLPGAGSGPQSFSGTYLCQHVTPYVLCPADAANVEEEEGETSQTVKHLPPSCFVGEWGEWSACDATCLGPFNFPQRHRKRSPIVADVVADDPDCILEEKQACGHSLESCVEVVRQIPTEEEDFVDAGFAEMKAVAPSAIQTSDWSGCDIPCLLAEGHVAHKRRLQLNTATGEFSAITSSDASAVCTTADGVKECKDLYNDTHCSDALPTYGDAASLRNCVDKCQSVEAKCKDLSSQDALKTPFKRCFVNGLFDAGFFLTCKFAAKQDISRPAKCRLAFTRIINPDSQLSFLTDTAAAGTSADSSEGEAFAAPSCACLDEGLEPCTAEDILEDWKGIRETFLAAKGLCSAEDANKPLWSSGDVNERLPDSSVYVAYAGLGRFHCPLPGYKKVTGGLEDFFTFTQFPNPNALNNFCQDGLSYWKDPSNPLFYVAGGKGLILCKEVMPKCEFTEWSEWSACTARYDRIPALKLKLC